MLKRTSDKIYAIALAVLVVGLFVANSTLSKQVTEEKLSDNYYTYSNQRFLDTRAEAKATLLNFYADWCASCTYLEPELRELFSEVGVRERIYGFRVPIGDNSETQQSKQVANLYGVKSQSTLVILNSQGKVFKSYIGKVSRQELKTALLAATLTV
jgi:thiol:disulfide interchange protein